MYAAYKKRTRSAQVAHNDKKREASQMLVGKRFIDEGVVMRVADVDFVSGDCLVRKGRKHVLYHPDKVKPLLLVKELKE